MKKVIFDSANLLVIATDANSDSVVVTFNERGWLPDHRRFWGDTLFEAAGVAAAGVVSRQPNWYPRQDMNAAIPALTEFINGRRCVTYGHSQGGYGAIKFSRALSAEKVFGFCPQWSIHPASVQGADDRFVEFYSAQLDGGLPIQPEDVLGDIFVVFDPRERLDRWNAYKILELPGTRPVVCPFGGHSVIRLVTESGQSKELVKILKSETSSASSMRRLLRYCRKNSITYQKQFAQKLGQRKYQGNTGLIVSQFTNEAKLSFLSEKGEHGEINSAVIDSLLNDCTDEQILGAGWYMLWRLCNRNKANISELRIARLIIKQFSSHGFARLHAVNSLIRCERIEEATEELRNIVDRFGVAPSPSHIRQFAEQLGLRDIAERARTTLT